MKKWISLALIFSNYAIALSPCIPDSPVGGWCEISIDQLHPTQPGIGLHQADMTQKKLAKKNRANLTNYLEKKVIPVVSTSDGDYWLVDRHHLTRALWQQGERKIKVKIIAHLDNNAHFWSEMVNKHWVWLNNERGIPVSPDSLPSHISALPDYPYRSLAGLLQNEGYFEKNEQIYFVEFVWARWLGNKMEWGTINSDNISERLEQAKILACSNEARFLPGYPGRKCRIVSDVSN